MQIDISLSLTSIQIMDTYIEAWDLWIWEDGDFMAWEDNELVGIDTA